MKKINWPELQTKVEDYTLSPLLSKFVVYGIKLPLCKILDFINNSLYFRVPQKVFTQDINLEEKEKELYDDFISRIDPDGLYMYAHYGDGIPDVGDRCIHQGIAIALECFRLEGIDKGKRDYTILIKLLKGVDKLVTSDGRLVRGSADWKFTGPDTPWIKMSKTKLPRFTASGDQLAGLCFGISVVLNFGMFNDLDITIKNSISDIMLRLTDRSIKDGWKLRSFKDASKKSQFGYFNPNLFLGSGAVVAPLALLSVAHQFAYTTKYIDEFERLYYTHGYKVLTKYSELHLLNWNNWFGANVCALGLYTLSIGPFNHKGIKAGLKRLVHNTRDYGHIMWEMFYNPNKHVDNYESKLKSYFVIDGDDKTSKPWWSKKVLRTSALSKRSCQDRDFIIQREPFREPMIPGQDAEWGIKYPRHDFLIEYYMSRLVK